MNYLLPEVDMEDILRVRACLSFAVQYDRAGMDAFDRIMRTLDELGDLVERLEDDLENDVNRRGIPFTREGE